MTIVEVSQLPVRKQAHTPGMTRLLVTSLYLAIAAPFVSLVPQDFRASPSNALCSWTMTPYRVHSRCIGVILALATLLPITRFVLPIFWTYR